MAPSLGCLNAVSLICAEEAQRSDWEDEIESFNAEQQQKLQGASLAYDESYLHDMFIVDHVLEEEDEVIEHLMQKEASLMPDKEYADSCNGSDNTQLQESRQRAVCWMLTVQACYGFTPCTVFLAVSYFDRFLANQQEILQKRIAPWLVQLLAVACVSLAAKVEETDVPLLLDLQVGPVPYVFEARTIQRMELLILSTLKWRLSSVTPFSFLGFLLQKMAICGRLCSNLLPRVEELILYSLGESRFVVYSPSVLAMTSLMCACDELLPNRAENCKRVLLSVWPSRESIIVECAGLMQELIVGADPFWTSLRRMIVSPNLSSAAPESPNGVLDAACFSCDSGNTICYSLQSANRQALHFSGAADCTTLRSAIAKVAAYSKPSSRSVCKTTDVCRKRKFYERYCSTSCIRTTPRAETARLNDRFKESRPVT